MYKPADVYSRIISSDFDPIPFSPQPASSPYPESCESGTPRELPVEYAGMVT